MAISVKITSATLTEGNPDLEWVMPAHSFLSDSSIINYEFSTSWSGASKVTSVEASIEVLNAAGRVGWALAKTEKTTATSGTRSFSGTLFNPSLSTGYGPPLTSLSDGSYTVVFRFYVWNGNSGGNALPCSISIKYNTYHAPKVTTFDVYRANASGARADDGTYLRYSITANIHPIEPEDVALFRLRYRQTGNSSWTNNTIGSGTISVNVSDVQIAGTFPISNSYDFQLIIADNYAPVSIAKLIPTGSVLMHFKADKSGVAFGKYAETSDLLDVNLPARFRYNVTLDTPLPVTGGGTGAKTGGAAMTNLGFGGIKMTGVTSTAKLATTTTSYIWYFTLDNYTSGLFSPWMVSGQSYYNGCRVLQAGWYLFNGRITFGDVSTATHGRLCLAVMDSSKESMITATLTGTSNNLPPAFISAAIDYYAATTDYETTSSLMAKACKLMYLPANAVVVVYANAQAANVSREGGFFEMCRVG